MNLLLPHQYARRILVMVAGMSSQVVTETLYALAITRQPAFVPTEIHIITTQKAAERILLDLLHPVKGQFHQLCRDYALPSIAFDASHIHMYYRMRRLSKHWMIFVQNVITRSVRIKSVHG